MTIGHAPPADQFPASRPLEGWPEFWRGLVPRPGRYRFLERSTDVWYGLEPFTPTRDQDRGLHRVLAVPPDQQLHGLVLVDLTQQRYPDFLFTLVSGKSGRLATGLR